MSLLDVANVHSIDPDLPDEARRCTDRWSMFWSLERQKEVCGLSHRGALMAAIRMRAGRGSEPEVLVRVLRGRGFLDWVPVAPGCLAVPPVGALYSPPIAAHSACR